MKRSKPSPLLLAITAGVVTGIRSFSGPAWAFHSRNHRIRRGLFALALGEMLADKTPWIPSRIKPLPLTGRAILGAVSATAVSSRRYAWIGAGSAIGAAVGAYYLRQNLGKQFKLRDSWIALAEDGITGVLGSRINAASAA